MSRTLCSLLISLIALQAAHAELPAPVLTAPFVTVDINVGEIRQVTLGDGQQVAIELLDLKETRDSLRNAVRHASIQLRVNNQQVTLESGNYRLPVEVGDFRLDCPVTSGYLPRSSKLTNGLDTWGLDKSARVRVWPKVSPVLNPGTFMYPLRQRWFASATQMANEPTYVDGGEKPGVQAGIYYHYGLDSGGAEGLVDVIAATDGLVVSVGKDVLPGYEGTPVAPRYDVVYLLDGRGWFYRYSHLKTISPELKPGVKIRMGDPVGVLGKEGGSGGWSHLHFDVSGRQPSGRWGIIEGYAFLWDAYVREHHPHLIAVARPHHFVAAGEKVTLDGGRSWSADGKLVRYEWNCADGMTADSVKLERSYNRPGVYSEILKVTDAAGRVDYDFAIVNVVDKSHPEDLPPSIHAAYAPTMNLRPGQAIEFLVRTFRTTDGEETWNFGDGTPEVKVMSDGNVQALAKDGYAVTSHKFGTPGIYIVRVSRTNKSGFTATAHLKVVIGLD